MANAVENEKQLIAELTANESKVPACAQLMMIQCQSALHWGGNWSLVSSDDADYEACLSLCEEIKQYGDTARAREVNGGLLLTAEAKWLVGIMTTLAPNYFGKYKDEYINRVHQVQQEEMDAFQKYWARAQKGSCDCFATMTKQGKRRLSGTIGVYCTNSTNNIAVNGINYPAFKLSAERLLLEMSKTPEAPYLLVNDVRNKRWMRLSQLVQNGQVHPDVVNCISFPIDSEGAAVTRPNALIMRFALDDMHAFKKYWLDTQAGKTECFNAKTRDGRDRRTGIIGIYCPNQDNKLDVQGITYPAFKITAEQLITGIAKMPMAERVHVVNNMDNVTVPVMSLLDQNGRVTVDVLKCVGHARDIGAASDALYMQFIVK